MTNEQIKATRRAYLAQYGGAGWIGKPVLATADRNKYARGRRAATQAKNKPYTALRVWRVQNNLRQDEAGEIFGVSNSAISNWETGASKVPEAVRRFIEKAACGAGAPQTAKKDSNT